MNPRGERLGVAAQGRAGAEHDVDLLRGELRDATPQPLAQGVVHAVVLSLRQQLGVDDVRSVHVGRDVVQQRAERRDVSR